jgi:hypothetical protein
VQRGSFLLTQKQAQVCAAALLLASHSLALVPDVIHPREQHR